MEDWETVSSMTPDLVCKALLLGALNAAPIGPVGMLCLQKNIEADRWRGLYAAFGMALAYFIVSFCVLFGLKWIGGFLETWRAPLQIAGGIALILMGWRAMRHPEAVAESRRCGSRYVGDFSSSFAMTLFNPVPFATFTVILTTFKVVAGRLDLVSDIHFALCVFAGTVGFWLVVNQVLHVVRKRSPTEWSRWIHHGTAAALVVFGVAILCAGLLGPRDSTTALGSGPAFGSGTVFGAVPVDQSSH